MTPIFACLSLMVLAAPPADSVSPQEGVNRLRSTLLEERARLDGEIEQLDRQTVQFRLAHQDLHFVPLVNQELSMISNALTQAKIATINARAEYPPNHPTTAKSQRCEDELLASYEKLKARIVELDKIAAEYDEMQTKLTRVREREQRVDEQLHDIALLQAIREAVGRDMDARAPATQPAR